MNNAMAVKFGSNIVIGFTDDMRLIRFGDEDVLAVKRLKGRITISILRVIDDRDNQVIRVDQDGYSLDRDLHLMFKKPDKSTLIVEDHLGRQILKLRYVSDRAISIEGTFRYPDFPPLTINEDNLTVGRAVMSHGCNFGQVPGRPLLDINKGGGLSFG